MPQTVQEMREQRATLHSEAKAIVSGADAEKREMSADEQQKFDRIMDQIDGLKAEIDKQEQAEQRRSRLADVETQLNSSAGRRTQTNPANDAGRTRPEPLSKRARLDARRKATLPKLSYRSAQDDYRSAWGAWLKGGFRGLAPQHMAAVNEVRALQADADITGGFLIPPLQFINRLIRFVSDNVYIRQLATVIPVTMAQSVGSPSLESDPNDADWTPELLTGAEDTAMSFGRRDLSPYPLAKRIKISNKLLRLAMGVENLVLERLAYKFAVTEEKAFLTGTGAQMPLGVMTADSRGISTARDVVCGTTTAITADGLIDVKFSLKQQYQNDPSLRWIFSRPALKQIRKLKDANGQYLWAPGISGGKPDTILECGYFMSEYMPATFTTGLYVGILGAFRNYWIADSLNMAVQRLDELYAETNQVGFIARRELDAMPVLEQAFARAKLA
jgi:HK97 family phage major capsid protein